MGVREDQVLVPFGGKVGKKLGKILHNPLLKKGSKKVKRSAQDEGGAREGQFLGKGFGLGMLKRLGTQETKLHVHIHTGQGQGFRTGDAQEAWNSRNKAPCAHPHRSRSRVSDWGCSRGLELKKQSSMCTSTQVKVKGFGLGMLKRLGTQETKLHVHIHT